MIFTKIKTLFVKMEKHVFACVSCSLPRTRKELEEFTASIGELYDVSDYPNLPFVVSSVIMHLPATQDRASKRFFGRNVRKLQANEAAYAVIEELRAQTLAKQPPQQKPVAPQPETPSNVDQTSNKN